MIRVTPRSGAMAPCDETGEATRAGGSDPSLLDAASPDTDAAPDTDPDEVSPPAGVPLLGDLTHPVIPSDPDTPCDLVDAMFRGNPRRRSLLVRDRAGGVRLLNRGAFYQDLTGPLGYGRALFTRRTVGEMLERADKHPSWQFDADMRVVDVALALLGESGVDDDMVVRWPDPRGQDRYGTIAVRDVFAELDRHYAVQNTRLARGEARFRALVRHSHDLILVIGADSEIRYASRRNWAPLGLVSADLRGVRVLDLLHPSDQPKARSALRRAADSTPEPVLETFRVRRADGEWRWVQCAVTDLTAQPAVAGIVVNARDVTDERELQEQLRRQAFHDPLTGLANRALFAERVTHALTRRRAGEEVVAVLFCDLDDFKTVNDGMGHALGDQLLVEVGRRLAASVRYEDTVARFGGDEFAVLLDGVDGQDAVSTVVHRLRGALAEPVELGGRVVIPGASIGVAVLDEPVGADELIAHADAAMYAAKRQGKGQGKGMVRWFEAGMAREAQDVLRLRSELVGAVDRGELVVHYQPIVELDGGHLVGFEALVRWQHPRLGLIGPGRFVPLAEESSLIDEVGRFVLDEACDHLRAWSERHQQALTMSVNVSPRQLRDDQIVEHVRAALARTGLPAARLTLEITESQLVTASAGMLTRLRALRDLGVRLAIDDFGTGYSSLAYLGQLPVDILKIDRSFVSRLGASADDDALVSTIVGLARMLRLSAVAEGIEEVDQQLALAGLGCQLGQGYRFAKPLPADLADELLTTLSSGDQSLVVT